MAGKIESSRNSPAALPAWLRPAILALAAVLLLACFSTEVADSDTWFHLQTGKYVVEHHRIPNPDPFSFTTYLGKALPGEEMMRAYNLTFSWLGQTILYLTYAAGGFGALVLLRAVLMTTFCALAGLWTYRRTQSLYRSLAAASVTGFVASWELDTLAKARFDQLSGWGAKFTSRVWSIDSGVGTGPAYPYTAGTYGAGAVYAFRCEALQQIGVFDPALGPGTPAHGAEDMDMFVRTILSRWSIAYEPSMVAWHDNRPTDEDFRRQIWGWGVGLSSYVTKLLTNSASRSDVWRRVPAGLRHMRTLNKRDRAARLPAGVVATQLAAWTYGPIGYARSRFGVRRDAHRTAPEL